MWPLCKEGDVVEECFRWEMRALVTAMEGLVRAYERVEEWGEGEGGIGEGWK